MSTSGKKYSNRLIHSTSPYLLQHAHNPVDWYPWGKEALEKAKQEDKPIILSIGYSACHWCHVMERESFENTTIADIMNKHFVCIKVDREERPDVDQIYMEALQAMGLQGGWPLNVFLMPDQKPFYGGTYFPPNGWAQLLLNIATAYKDHRVQLQESADNFSDALQHSEIKKFKLSPDTGFSKEDIISAFHNLASKFDLQKGGMSRAPKFPMPSNWLFVLRYYHAFGDKRALEQLNLTLRQMAFGGIYDQLGGGFARYSVDAEWFAPHFEKMLYDNGQLLSLYSEAYSLTGDKEYLQVIDETISFTQRELMSEEGGFYSALDADSEGEEGKFYVWKKDEIDFILKDDSALFCQYYYVKEGGNWEHHNNILFRKEAEEEFALKSGLDMEALKSRMAALRSKLFEARSKRIRPGLDNKILAGWNGMMLKGICDAYAATSNEKYLQIALANAHFIEKNLLKNGRLKRTYSAGSTDIAGYMEDYAWVISAFISLYQVSFDEKWIKIAEELCNYTLQNFFDKEEEMFFFIDHNAEKLITRKKEMFDNVIPSSNSVMATNLHFLYLLTSKGHYAEISDKMLRRMIKLIVSEPAYSSNWATLYLLKLSNHAEIAIIGSQANEVRKEIAKHYFPNKVIAGTETKSALPLLQSREALKNKTTIYICQNNSCKLPVHSAQTAIEQLKDLLKLHH